MTREETIKILAILKAAYPNSYKNMTKDEANGTVTIWAMQFANIPADVVMIAINKLISTSPFPPAICEVKEKIKGMYWESCETGAHIRPGRHKFKTELVPFNIHKVTSQVIKLKIQLGLIYTLLWFFARKNFIFLHTKTRRETPRRDFAQFRAA